MSLPNLEMLTHEMQNDKDVAGLLPPGVELVALTIDDAPAGGSVKHLSDLPADVLEKVLLLLKDPCEEKWDNICATDTRFAKFCSDDQFWYTLCKREGWHRDDRVYGWHAMENFTWRKQFFKWCKLRFGPVSEEEVLRIVSWDTNVVPKHYALINKAGFLQLKDVVETFLDQTGGTGVLDNPREYYSSEDGGVSIVQKYGPMNTWDVSRVTTMRRLFDDCRAFNAYIGQWDTSSVTSMERMFVHATAFNNGAAGGKPAPPLKWNVSKVTSMDAMFQDASAFNADIGGWDTSKVTNMYGMFLHAKAFNQDLRRWNVSKVESFINMFYGARAFDQNLSDWNKPNEGRIVKEEANKYDMFVKSGISNDSWPSWGTKH